MTQTVVEAHADIAEVYALAKKVADVIDGCALEDAMGALLTLLFTSLSPDITEDQLIEGVKGASGWMVTYLAAIDPSASVN